MNNQLFIYVYDNKINGKIYIGQTDNLIERDRGHTKYGSKSMPIDCAIKKYGRENFDLFTITIIDTYERADQEEIFWIAETRRLLGRENVYNITDGGMGTRGRTLSQEQKQNLSNIAKNLGLRPPNHRGRKLTKEHKQKISLANKGKPGRPLSKEHKQKLLESHLGKDTSEETRKKLSDSHKGAKAYNYIYFTDEQIVTIKQDQRSVRVIAKDYGVSPSKIQTVRGKIGKRKRTLSDEHKQKLSEAKKGKPGNKGKPSNRKGKTWIIIDGKRVWVENK